jgi:uncharacterized protein involved in response to NO
LHLLARYTGVPLFALDLTIAPIWAHAFLMLFAVFPLVIFGFLFTVYPRWMNGPLVRRAVYLTAASTMSAGTVAWLAGTYANGPWLLVGCALVGLGLAVGIAELMRVLVAAPQAVSHAIVTLLALCVQLVALAGFAYGVLRHDDIALHYAVRVALWGGLLPVFFAVSHRMIPFFSTNAVARLRAVAPGLGTHGRRSAGLWTAARRCLGGAVLVARCRCRAIRAHRLVRPALVRAPRTWQSAALVALRGFCVAADRRAAADGARRELHAYR